MNTLPLISVIIPAYNLESHIKKTIDSVLLQTYSNIEIIVVDDGSKDNTYKILQEYNNKHDNIHIVRQNNSGVSSARNKGLSLANGKYVTFVDGDDIILPNALELSMSIADKNDNLISFLVRRTRDGESDGIVEGYGEEEGTTTNLKNNHSIMKTYLQNYNLRAYSHIFNKQTVDDISFDCSMRIHEDAVFTVHILKKSSQAKIINKPLYIYTSRADSAMKTITQDDLKDINKHIEMVESLKETYPKLNNIINKHVLAITSNLLTASKAAGDRNITIKARKDMFRKIPSLNLSNRNKMKYYSKIIMSFLPKKLFGTLHHIIRKHREVI